MKKVYWISTLSILAFCFLLGGIFGAHSLAAEKVKTYELNFTSDYMDKHPTVRNAFLPWAKLVGERSGGRVNYHLL